MSTAAALIESPSRRVQHRTRGHRHGPITRLMSPSDLGHVLKPFVFLDLFDTGNARSEALGLHPHSGIATLTWLFQGAVSYEDTNGASGTLRAGSLEWMRAGAGVWHGGGFGDEGRSRGFQLWIALPPQEELGPSESIYLSADQIPTRGPARVLLGEFAGAVAPLRAPSPLLYMAVTLKAGETWTFSPPPGHTVCWMGVGSGSLRLASGDSLTAGELVTLESGHGDVEMIATTNTEFVLGSGVPHDHDLVMGYYSVHTSRAALQQGEEQIIAIQRRLIASGRTGLVSL